MGDGAQPRCYFCSLLCPLGAERTPADRFLPSYPDRGDGLRGLCGRGHTTCELLGHPERRNAALLRTSGTERAVPLNQALAELATLLKGVWEPAGVALLVDGNLPAEDIAAAGRFAERCLEGAAWSIFLPPSDQALLAGLGDLPPATVEDLSRAQVTLVVGDPFVSHPVAARPVLEAKLASRDARLLVMDCLANVTSRFATQALRVPPGLEPQALARLARELGASEEDLGPLGASARDGELEPVASDLARWAEALREAERAVLIVAPELTRTGTPAALAAAARAVARLSGAKVLALPSYGNARAAAALAVNLGATPLAEVLRRLQGGQLRALMVLGGDPLAAAPWAVSREMLAGLEVLAVAEALPTLTGEEASVVLPLALAAEAGGTVVDCFGRVAEGSALAPPPRGAATVRGLLAGLAEELAAEPPGAEPVKADWLKGPEAAKPQDLLAGVSVGAAPGPEQLWLVGRASAVHYDGGSLTRFAGWARAMEPGPQAAVSPATARRLGLGAGEELILKTTAGEVRLPCAVWKELDEATVVVEAAFPEVRSLFGRPLPEKGEVLPSGPVPVALRAAETVATESTQG